MAIITPKLSVKNSILTQIINALDAAPTRSTQTSSSAKNHTPLSSSTMPQATATTPVFLTT